MKPIELYTYHPSNEYEILIMKIFATEKIPYAIDLYPPETARILRVLDGEFAKRPYLAADRHGIADIMTWPWINVLSKLGIMLDAFPHLHRWHAGIAERPAVQRGVAIPVLREHDTAA